MNDLAKWNVKGPVTTLRSETAEWDADKQSWKPPRFVSMVHFRPDGQVSEAEHGSPDGSIFGSSFDYDHLGRLKEARYRTNSNSASKAIYSYDNSGRLTRILSVAADGTQRVFATYRYDDANRKTAEIVLPMSLADAGSIAISADFDDSEQSDQTIWYDLNHRFVRRMTFRRDAAGRLLQANVHIDDPLASMADNPGEFPSEAREQLMAMLTSRLGPDHILAGTTFIYDETGRKLESRTQMAGLSDNRTAFRYDAQDNPIEETTTSTTREVQTDEAGGVHPVKEDVQTQHTRYAYQYDSRGNWIERIVSQRSEPDPDFKPTSVERREISYYV
jgi:YD repeat-containing protein